MLQLGSRSARRIGASYTCASCLSASHPLRSHRATILSSQHGPPFSTTSRQATASTQPSTPDTNAANVESSAPPPQKPASKKAKKKAAKKVNAKTPPHKTNEPQTDTQRQLNILQGALEALKNVLAAKNIDVSQIAKLSQLPESPTTESTSGINPNKAAAKGKKANQPKKESKKAARKLAREAKKKESPDEPAEAETESTPESTLTETTDSAIPPKSTKPSKLSKAAAAKPAPKPNPRAARRAEAKAALASKNAGATQKKEDTDPDIIDEDGVSGDAEPIAPSTTKTPFTGESPSPEILAKMGLPPRRTPPAKKKKKEPEKEKNALKISTIDPARLHLIPVRTGKLDVPALSYGLERVLFNQGVYQLQDPRSRVYNFDPYLSEIMPIQEFDFNALKQYVTSSKDNTLISIARDYKSKYTGSTSSMTSMLAHFHYLLSSWREVNTQMLSQEFEPESRRFTTIMRAPAATFLHWKDGTYAIDADKEFDSANILSMLGKSMEKLLTLSKEDYERYRHVNSDMITEEERNAEEAFHYTRFLDFMMRSQLDAHDPRVPGTGMFDLKTRAVISIRMDAKGFQKGLGYEIRKRFGQWESFEREYYDMIRSAFLKYSLQVRMGRMDGIFVAFHNTERIFGFQYIPLSEMDLALHGTSNTTIGHKEFKLSLKLLNDVLNRATNKWPKQSLRLHFETRPSTVAPYMYIFAEPVQQGDVEAVQNANKASIEEFEREILGLGKQKAKSEPAQAEEADEVVDEEVVTEEAVTEEAAAEEPELPEEMSSLAAWEEARQMVEDAMDDDELGVGTVREAIEDALEQSGLLHARSATEAEEYVDALLAAMIGSHPSELDKSPTTQVEDQDAGEDEDELVADNSASPKSDGIALQDAEPNSDASQEIEESGAPSEGQSSEGQLESQVNEVNNNLEATQSEASELPDESQIHQAENQPESSAEAQKHATDVDANQHSALSESEKPADIDKVASAESSEVSTLEESETSKEDDTDDMETEGGEIESGAEADSSPSLSPLKDLIVRMARRIHQKPPPRDSAETSAEDSSKLKAFERILGKLISLSKDGQIQSESSTEQSADKQSAEAQGHDSLDQSVEKLAEHTAEVLSDQVEDDIDDQRPLMGMVLTIKNKVNGRYVTRPEKLGKDDDWTVEYNIEELAEQRARTIYTQCKLRRRKTFQETENKDREWYRMFQGKLDSLTKRGRKHRAMETIRAQGRPVHVMGLNEPLNWHDVFKKPIILDKSIVNKAQTKDYGLEEEDDEVEDDEVEDHEVEDHEYLVVTEEHEHHEEAELEHSKAADEDDHELISSEGSAVIGEELKETGGEDTAETNVENTEKMTVESIEETGMESTEGGNPCNENGEAREKNQA
ncbi:Pet127-domain-containing protein [Biscogniauxia mediterranea]|nr:Pet127-domain-containing protein [Biscogniauxia mediterranea]